MPPSITARRVLIAAADAVLAARNVHAVLAATALGVRSLAETFCGLDKPMVIAPIDQLVRAAVTELCVRMSKQLVMQRLILIIGNLAAEACAADVRRRLAVYGMPTDAVDVEPTRNAFADANFTLAATLSEEIKQICTEKVKSGARS
jgi:hypothetical protein